VISRYRGAVDFVADELAPLGVADLERLAAALWVRRRHPDSSDADRAARIHELKPHVSVESAQQALSEVAKMEQEAEAAVAA
jgi:hypothetical protein